MTKNTPDMLQHFIRTQMGCDQAFAYINKQNKLIIMPKKYRETIEETMIVENIEAFMKLKGEITNWNTLYDHMSNLKVKNFQWHPTEKHELN